MSELVYDKTGAPITIPTQAAPALAYSSNELLPYQVPLEPEPESDDEPERRQWWVVCALAGGVIAVGAVLAALLGVGGRWALSAGGGPAVPAPTTVTRTSAPMAIPSAPTPTPTTVTTAAPAAPEAYAGWAAVDRRFFSGLTAAGITITNPGGAVGQGRHVCTSSIKDRRNRRSRRTRYAIALV